MTAVIIHISRYIIYNNKEQITCPLNILMSWKHNNIHFYYDFIIIVLNNFFKL